MNSPDKIMQELQKRLMSRPVPESSLRSREHLPRVICADGFNVSVQANRYNYCSPRLDDGPWSSVELGFPSAPMPELADYIDGAEPNATDTVWGFVPLREVANVLASHGGLLSVGSDAAMLATT